MSSQFIADYQALEENFRRQADRDGDVFIPNVPPLRRSDFVIVGMEPSIKWASSEQDARKKVYHGFKNFMYSMEDFILHFAFGKFLCGPGETYHVTDISKGAMSVLSANIDRDVRWSRWLSLLEDELSLVAKPNAKIFALGSKVAEFLSDKGRINLSNTLRHWNGRTESCSTLLQHSWNASKWRAECAKAKPREYTSFAASITHSDVARVADDILERVRPSREILGWISGRVARAKLSDSRKRLLFTYRTQMLQEPG